MRTVLSAALFLTTGFAAAQPPRPPADMLAERVAALEQRVSALEQRAAPAPSFSAPAFAPSAVVVPPGQHAHRTVDGRVIVHGDWNQGNAAAHAGVAYPWAKVAVAGQTIQGGVADQTFGGFGDAGGGCPPGGCPAGRAVGFRDGPVRRFLRR